MCLCVCYIECFPIGIWMLFVYKFSYSFSLSLPFFSFCFFAVVSNSQLTIMERKLFYVRAVDMYMYQKYTFESNIPASTLINQFYNVRETIRRERTRERERIDRTNERENKIVDTNEICFMFPLCCVWMSEWVIVCITVFTYLFIVSRVHIVGSNSISRHFESMCLWNVCMPECVAPLTFVCFRLFVCDGIPTLCLVCLSHAFLPLCHLISTLL